MCRRRGTQSTLYILLAFTQTMSGRILTTAMATLALGGAKERLRDRSETTLNFSESEPGKPI